MIDLALEMATAVKRTPFFEALQRHDASSTAIVNHHSGVAFSYGSLLRDVARAKYRLIQKVGEGHDIAGERIAFMIESGYGYVGTFTFSTRYAPAACSSSWLLNLLYSRASCSHRVRRCCCAVGALFSCV